MSKSHESVLIAFLKRIRSHQVLTKGKMKFITSFTI